MAKKVTLINWINELGTGEVAKLLRVTEANVRHWRNQRTLPRTELMLLIKKYTRGALTCDAMIADFHKATPSKK